MSGRLAELTKEVRGKEHRPKLRRVRSEGWRDKVRVRMIPAQSPEQWEVRRDNLAHSFNARACRVRVLRPRVLELDFIHADPLVAFRHLFTTRVALRLDEPVQVDMVLGDGVRQRGAAAHEISENTPGVAWNKEDGQREPERARAFNVTDADLVELGVYLAPATVHEFPDRSEGREAA